MSNEKEEDFIISETRTTERSIGMAKTARLGGINDLKLYTKAKDATRVSELNSFAKCNSKSNSGM